MMQGPALTAGPLMSASRVGGAPEPEIGPAVLPGRRGLFLRPARLQVTVWRFPGQLALGACGSARERVALRQLVSTHSLEVPAMLTRAANGFFLGLVGLLVFAALSSPLATAQDKDKGETPEGAPKELTPRTITL